MEMTGKRNPKNKIRKNLLKREDARQLLCLAFIMKKFIQKIKKLSF